MNQNVMHDLKEEIWCNWSSFNKKYRKKIVKGGDKVKKSLKVFTDNNEEFSITYDFDTKDIAFTIHNKEEFQETFYKEDISQEMFVNILKGFIHVISLKQEIQ